MKHVLIHNRDDIYGAFSASRVLYRDSDGNTALTDNPVTQSLALGASVRFSDKQSLYCALSNHNAGILYSGCANISSSDICDFSGFKGRASSLIKRFLPEFETYNAYQNGLLIRKHGEVGINYGLNLIDGKKGSALLSLVFGEDGLTPRSFSLESDFREHLDEFENLINTVFHDHIQRSKYPRDGIYYLIFS